MVLSSARLGARLDLDQDPTLADLGQQDLLGTLDAEARAQILWDPEHDTAAAPRELPLELEWVAPHPKPLEGVDGTLEILGVDELLTTGVASIPPIDEDQMFEAGLDIVDALERAFLALRADTQTLTPALRSP